jgi:hypothetical protein
MDVTYTSPAMSLEPAESATIRVVWRESGYLYELRWYGTPDFIVPVWWLGITEMETEELTRTEVLHPTAGRPGAVFRWLFPIVGQDVARQLVTRAASAASPNGARVS